MMTEITVPFRKVVFTLHINTGNSTNIMENTRYDMIDGSDLTQSTVHDILG